MNIYLDTVGCRLNQSEIEIFARQFQAAGHTIVADPDNADLTIINTCTVTAQAAADSRQKIRRAARLGTREIIVTGCWASMEADSAEALPGVSQVITNLDKDQLVPRLLHLRGMEYKNLLIARQPLPGTHHRTRAFIKVQDGCDNRCTYCVTCLARGKSRSRLLPDIIRDIEYAIAVGTREIVLTGVHLGAWGADLQPAARLKDMVQILLTETNVPRLRLSSLEPWDMDESFFELWQDSRMCRHLHVPLQSGCAETLRRMGRKTTPQRYADLLRIVRSKIPEIAITTDIIVGFPGEDEKEFSTSFEYIRGMGFARGHVFTYSARAGTAAALMPDQVPYPLRKQRNQQLRDLFAKAEQDYWRQFLGQRVPVLWENTHTNDRRTWQLNGLTDTYIRVHAQASEDLWNQISLVELVSISDSEMQGIIRDRSEGNP